MKLIILAAGKGERLWPLTKNTPKPLLDLGNGNTLLEEQLERVQSSGVIDEVVLVTGYLSEQIEAKLRTMMATAPIRIKTLYNPFYDVANNLASLWLARHDMHDDFIITNGDNLFASDVFTHLVAQNQRNGIYLSVVLSAAYDEDDMKVRVQNGSVVQVSKTIATESADAESVGLALVRGDQHRRLFVEHVEQLIRDKANLARFWLETFNSLQRSGIATTIWPFDGEKWQEVDFHMDVAKARTLLSSTLAKLPAETPSLEHAR